MRGGVARCRRSAAGERPAPPPRTCRVSRAPRPPSWMICVQTGRWSRRKTCPASGEVCPPTSSPSIRGASSLLDFRGERFERRVEALRGVDDIVGERHFGGNARALFDAAAAEVAPVGGEVLADRDVERAAVGERLLLL